jgi:hypothetical protein
MAACPTRLFPSTNGWLQINEVESDRLLLDAGVEIIAPKGHPRLSDGRFERPEIAKTARATGLCNDPTVELEYLGQG